MATDRPEGRFFNANFERHLSIKGAMVIKAPNGYGSVTHLKGNRRNPFVVRKTTGWNEKGHHVYQVIGYYPTREAGLIALAQFNNEPWNVTQEKLTLEELFQLWEEKKAVKLGLSNRQSLKSAFKHCSKLNKLKYIVFLLKNCTQFLSSVPMARWVAKPPKTR
jgi:hypothetical protein